MSVNELDDRIHEYQRALSDLKRERKRVRRLFAKRAALYRQIYRVDGQLMDIHAAKYADLSIA